MSGQYDPDSRWNGGVNRGPRPMQCTISAEELERQFKEAMRIQKMYSEQLHDHNKRVNEMYLDPMPVK